MFVLTANDFERIRSSLSEGVPQDESIELIAFCRYLVCTAKTVSERREALKYLVDTMEDLAPIAILVDIGEQDIEQNTWIWTRKRNDLLVRFYATAFSDCKGRDQKLAVIEDMKNLHRVFHSMRKVLVNAGINDQYENLVSRVKQSIKNIKAIPIYFGGSHEKISQ
ncbi:MAG: hypothetical protein FJZ96_06860 [Chloroflexi bacterium]|nr:hypothetical protein [Chloroflexota bacterium]